ncbi:hypothetical protein KP509_20G037900 [Ceratopteris richardii]|uniref:HAT C-terminal dimerisation domain-containing protein n=1 Tax=Ceratopteris richardii TaxID=49495 RepID=A0A8T2SEI4_CERRI|nr:hypothetical protein KP509_20G037900 [Ceratopteris richardii]
MKIVYFCALEDIPLEKYQSHCRLLRELGTPNMPASEEYGSYMNAVSAREMLLAIKHHVKMQLILDIHASPFYSLLIDESTDRTIKKHLIIYVLYVTDAGKGPTKCAFVELLAVENANAKCIYEAINAFINENMLDIRKLIAIATDGASVMIGHKTGVLSCFQESMPHIMGVHCIAHRQALAAKDGFITHPHIFAFVDKVANKVYSWLGKSSKRPEELWRIMHEYDMLDTRALQIHAVRWLSRGQVMERLVNIMPAILHQWEHGEKRSYKNITIFSVQFMIHFLANVFKELNKLSMEFQRHEMDVSRISAMLGFTIEKFKGRYLDVDVQTFGHGSPHLSSLLQMTKGSMLFYEDVSGQSHAHVLRFEAMPMDGKKKRVKEISDSDGDDDEIDLNTLPNNNEGDNGSLDECISIAKAYIKNILDGLNRRFEDLPLFNAFKIFSPSSYPVDAYDREKMTQEWLNRIINLLNIDSHMIDIRKSINEREDFCGMLYRVAQHKSMPDAWVVCNESKSWWNLYPEMMKIWQLCLVIPASTSACERGFSHQIFIKSVSRSSLALDTLDALMLLSIDGRGSSSIDWKDVFQAWLNAKKKKEEQCHWSSDLLIFPICCFLRYRYVF